MLCYNTTDSVEQHVKVTKVMDPVTQRHEQPGIEKTYDHFASQNIPVHVEAHPPRAFWVRFPISRHFGSGTNYVDVSNYIYKGSSRREKQSHKNSVCLYAVGEEIQPFPILASNALKGGDLIQ